MGLLTGLLAVAAIMVVLSTLTTAIMEIIHAALKKRVKALEQQMGAMFDRVFTPEGAAALNRAKFVAGMVTNPVSDKAAKRESLDLRQFVQQLANTEVGTALATGNPAGLKQRLAEIGAQFERYSEGKTEMVKNNAGFWTAIAGVALAVYMNVDGALVADRLFNNQALAEKVVINLPAAELKKLAEGGEQPTVPASQVRFEGLGLPIGSAYFPFCEGNAAADIRCDGAAINPKTTAMVRALTNLSSHGEWAISWLLSILATGALIGLGAPFWFDIYKRLAGLATWTKLPETIFKPVAVEAAEKQGQKLLTADDLVEIFKLALPKS